MSITGLSFSGSMGRRLGRRAGIPTRIQGQAISRPAFLQCWSYLIEKMLLQEALPPDDQLDPNFLETEVFEREEEWADHW